ncbi:MAG: DUF1460 domain-containing protein [Nitrospirae bacterium]|nr:DUF1460 domain-containing protein [Nitrospirota bacterium]
MSKPAEVINLGKWTAEELEQIISDAAAIKDNGSRIMRLSNYFLETPYNDLTLIGDLITPESFVVNLADVDCLTFIEYIEAMSLSSSFLEFLENLRQVRYRDGYVSFKNRNHFFSDWSEFNREFVEDITEQVSGGRAVKIVKLLNIKEDGGYLLNGVQPEKRMIKYIPSDSIDTETTERLMTGDYIGIYSDKDGLDVSHVGIFISDKNRSSSGQQPSLFLRHASSAIGKVVDEDFKTYSSKTPGIVILRKKSKRKTTDLT